MLGPYRNLTTLTASLLALHPGCQVLNHAGTRIFVDSDLNFLENYSPGTFDNFVRFALYISTSGREGPYGGSITLSHAFEHSKMKQAYQSRFLDTLTKKDPTCLVWKESLKSANQIRDNQFDLDEVFAGNERLRFLMPVRHPLDCATSNKIKVQNLAFFRELDSDPTIEELAEAILNELVWFLGLKKRHPDRFFYYLQNDFDAQTVRALADFLKLAPDSEWGHSVLDCYDIKSGYEHPAPLVASYKRMVEEKFVDYPDVQASLLAFVD